MRTAISPISLVFFSPSPICECVFPEQRRLSYRNSGSIRVYLTILYKSLTMQHPLSSLLSYSLWLVLFDFASVFATKTRCHRRIVSRQFSGKTKIKRARIPSNGLIRERLYLDCRTWLCTMLTCPATKISYNPKLFQNLTAPLDAFSSMGENIFLGKTRRFK